jgi:DNA-directed RNA polymerase subunit RPC12/RpoP
VLLQAILPRWEAQAMSSTYHVRTGQRCQRCSKDMWLAISGHLRCECGQRLWIERTSDASGLHFPYKQGAQVPKTFQGWLETTK